MIRMSVIPPEVLLDRRRKVAMGVTFPKAKVELPDRGKWRAWPGMAASTVVHALAFAAAAGLMSGGGGGPEETTNQDRGPQEEREVAMVYLDPPAPEPEAQAPPPTPEPPQPQPQETAPPSQAELPPPGPESNEVLSPAPARETNTALAQAAETPAEEPQAGADDRQNVISTEAVVEDGGEDLAAATEARGEGLSIDEEARRIFGRPTTGTGNRNNALPWASDSTCVPDPTPPDPNAPVVLDSISGVVFDHHGMALGGAHLQVVGTKYHAFSDGGGRYSLVFDVGLVANCRVQVVRVSAAGYRGRDLYLAMGVGNNDVYMQR